MVAFPTPSSTLADADGWWLEAHCICGRTTALPCRLLARQMPADRDLAGVAAKLRCRGCGARALSVELTDDPQAGALGHVGAGRAQRIMLR